MDIDTSQNTDYSALPLHGESTDEILEQLYQSQQGHQEILDKFRNHSGYERDLKIKGKRSYNTPRHVKT